MEAVLLRCLDLVERWPPGLQALTLLVLLGQGFLLLAMLQRHVAVVVRGWPPGSTATEEASQ